MNVGSTASKILKDSGKAVAGHKGALVAAGLNLGIGTFFGMREGESFSTAVIKTIPETVAWAVAPWTMTAITAASLVPIAVQGYIRVNNQHNKNRRVGTNFTYQDTQQALTMRQASVQAIQGSKMNARNALGGEASLMHRGYGNMIGYN